MNKFMMILPITGICISNVSFAQECPAEALVGKYNIISSECTGLSCKSESEAPWTFSELLVSEMDGSDFISLSESKEPYYFTHYIKQSDFDQPDPHFWTYCTEGIDLTGKFSRTLGYLRDYYSPAFETRTVESLQLVQNENRIYAIQDIGIYSKDYVPKTEYRFTVELEKS